MHRYIGMHPDVITHDRLEFAFFVDRDEFAVGFETIYGKYFSRQDPGKKLLIKNVGIIYYEDAIKRLHEHNPATKLLVVLRNPVERAYSAYQYAKMMGFERSNSFEEAIKQDLPSIRDHIIRGTVDYLGRGLYEKQLAIVYKYYPKDQVKVLLQEDLQRDPMITLKDCFGFCGLDDSFVPDFSKKFNESGRARFPLVMQVLKRTRALRKRISAVVPSGFRKRILSGIESINREDFKAEPMEAATRRFLESYFEEPNNRLGQMLGRDLSGWNNSK